MYRRVAIAALLLVGTCFSPGDAKAADRPPQPGVAELLEDDGEALLKQLSGGPGEGHVEKGVVFSGKSSLKIIPMQRYARVIPGWKYRIMEKPKAGEYRYVRFAWKADGCAGIMLQLHDERDWNIRYTAGLDVENWGTKFVADKPPGEWTVVTCDLFKDFGARVITGIALTAHGGRAGYFDHIYFGRTVEDLDRIDVTGTRGRKPAELTADELDRLWWDLAAVDAAKGYLAFWSLAACPKQAVPFLREKIAGKVAGASAEQFASWARELDDDDFKVRTRATQELGKHVEAASPLLQRVLADSPSAEVRARIERLLAGREGVVARKLRVEKAVRVMEYSGSAEARKSLEDLANGDDARLRDLAKGALKRLEAPTEK